MINELMQVSEEWPADKRIRVGERGGKKVEGCDEGNSPLNFTPKVAKDKRLFMTTTNGTRCLRRVENALVVLAAALVNRARVVKYLIEKQPETIWILGSGWVRQIFWMFYRFSKNLE